ncbi:hypothetical protein C5167_019345 [Papaver somniferum]|uniref:Uncharacterized protein n=1 Tax=Papaver somniferum TaxID=3469 RepID=A0A4Y7IPX7_PAPSO|nr:hypothetical protein C5167_019345 [Papaver somniferum]
MLTAKKQRWLDSCRCVPMSPYLGMQFKSNTQSANFLADVFWEIELSRMCSGYWTSVDVFRRYGLSRMCTSVLMGSLVYYCQVGR